MNYDKVNVQRVEKIVRMFPDDIEKVLNIGSRGNMFDKYYDVISLDAIEDSDIKQDLNLNQKLKLKDKSVDIVIMDQILEHLGDVEVLIKEAIRVSKKYIFIGLPNEVVFSNRIRILFGGHIEMGDGYDPYGHKHFFRINTIENFIKKFFNDYQKKDYLFIGTGGTFLPLFFKNFLARKFPKLFAGHVYYLLRKDEKMKR